MWIPATATTTWTDEIKHFFCSWVNLLAGSEILKKMVFTFVVLFF